MTKIETSKNLFYYLSLPYTTVLRRDDEGDVIARIDELPGCVAHGKDEAEALANLTEAKELWLDDCIESGEVIPEPVVEEALPSGKWVQRVPRKLHQRLARTAKEEGVSLNQLVTSMLSEKLGIRTVEKAMEQFAEATCASAALRQHPKHYWDRSLFQLPEWSGGPGYHIMTSWSASQFDKLMPPLEVNVQNDNQENYFVR